MDRSKLPGQGLSIFAIMSGLANEHGAINLSQGFPDFEGDPRLISLVHQYMTAGKNQYAPMAGVPELRDEIAKKVNRLYGNDVSAETEITVTAGATQAIFNTLQALIHTGDEVVIMEPAYDSYLPGVLLAGGKPVSVPFRAPDFDWPWDALEKAITRNTKLIIITNPHNPLGKVLSDEDMNRLVGLGRKHNLLFLFDEVYEHLTFDQHRHNSALANAELYDRSIVTFSFGKTFHHTGWKVGYSIAPPAITKEIRKVHQFNVFSVNTPVQYALADYMASKENYDDLATFFEHKRNLLTQGLEETPFQPLPCNGSYFLLADYSAISQEDDLTFSRWLTKEHGVATIPLSPFYSGNYDGKVVRFCFAKKDETLRSALDRLEKI